MCSAVALLALAAALQIQERAHASDHPHGRTYRLNIPLTARGLDPARMNDSPSMLIAAQIYDLLVDYDSASILRPRLATSWEVSADGTRYTYHLRRDVRFQDDECFPGGKGRLLTARDVKYSFDRLLDQRAGAFNATYFLDKVRGARAYYEATGRATSDVEPTVAGVSGFRVVDEGTFAIELERPFGPFKHLPALPICAVYPREAVEHYGKTFYYHPVGSGAFQLKEWRNEERILLARNRNYWRRDARGAALPYLDSIAITFKKDEREAMRDFENGKLDELFRPSRESVDSLIGPRDGDDGRTPLSRDARYQVLSATPLGLQYYGMLTTRPPFNDPRVRRAFNHAVDREQLARFVLLNQGAPASHGIVPAGIPGYAVESTPGYANDVAKARALMAEAGYPNGEGFPEVEIKINNGNERAELVAQGVSEMIESALGIRVRVKRVSFAMLMEQIESGHAPLFRNGWLADYPDPEVFLSLLYGGSPNAINGTRYANPAFDTLFERALGTTDDAARYELYRRAERIALDDAPFLLLYHDIDLLLLHPYVRGLRLNALERFDYSEVWFAE